jgi:hypothetical protein
MGHVLIGGPWMGNLHLDGRDKWMINASWVDVMDDTN